MIQSNASVNKAYQREVNLILNKCESIRSYTDRYCHLICKNWHECSNFAPAHLLKPFVC